MLTDESMATTIPTPLPAWKKWALTLGATPNSFLVSFLDYIEQIPSSADPSPGEWRHVEIVWENTVTALKADECVVTLDLANITNGGLDSSWTSTDYATTDGILQACINNWAAHMAGDMQAKEVRYYRRVYNPYTDQKPFPPSGPPEHVFPITTIGTNSTTCAHQVAVTHTEITAYPRHWGRAYWPVPGTNLIYGGGGYLAQTFVDAWAAEIQNTYEVLMNAEFFPTVPTTQVNGVASRQLLGIAKIQVDNVPDVVRRRRPRTTTYRKVLPV
jgi:hypothetical protein